MSAVPDPSLHAGGRLTIDLSALADNWRALRDLAAPGACGAAVKADAYGLGLEPVSRTLWEAGCRSFFVALPSEAFALRGLLSEADIFCLGGLTPGGASDYVANAIQPVLNSVDEVYEWASKAPRLPAALHIDTGMNRLGLRMEEARALTADMPDVLNLSLVMTHLACADDPDHALNSKQAEQFAEIRALFPNVPMSFANSAGTLTGGTFKSDLSRPGIALYGGASAPVAPNPIKPVIKLEARIMQVRDVPAGEAVGYGATQIMERDSHVAILGVGYADGYHRLIGSHPDAAGFINGQCAPMVGRVSMDLIAIDVTDIDPRPSAGDFVELINEQWTVDDVARCANTIGYEVLTGLGQRYQRIYI